MTLADGIILFLLLAALAGVFFYTRRRKRRGGCCCGCSGCPHAKGCGETACAANTAEGRALKKNHSSAD